VLAVAASDMMRGKTVWPKPNTGSASSRRMAPRGALDSVSNSGAAGWVAGGGNSGTVNARAVVGNKPDRSKSRVNSGNRSWLGGRVVHVLARNTERRTLKLSSVTPRL